MILEILKMFFLVVLQNASFTWVSRARNSGNLKYHAIAAVFSNGIWLLVIRQVVINFDKIEIMITYLVAAVVGSVLMHWFSMKYLEKGSRKVGGKEEVVYTSADANVVFESLLIELSDEKYQDVRSHIVTAKHKYNQLK